FPFRRRWSLWMLGMRIAIDVVWIDNGRVVGIERGIARPPNVRESLTLHTSPLPVLMALELAAGRLPPGVAIDGKFR
ncbi:MAG: DUF192 domain-containing protein, partial [Pseudomonadota bacterium]